MRKAEVDALAEAAKLAKEQRKKQKEERKLRLEKIRQQQWIDAVRFDIWTQEQQNCLEIALLDAPYTTGESRLEKEQRWDFVASAVDGKSRNQCLNRYKLLKQMTKNRLNSSI